MSSSDRGLLPYRLIARLGAIALFLSTIEYMIPKPVPFMRLGLANIPIMISLELLSPLGVALLVLMKVIGQALVNGTLFSYVAIFSLSGTLASSLIMFMIVKLLRRHVSYVGISLAGALCSNLVQLTLSRYMIFGQTAWLLAPPFLIMGGISSLLLGLFTERFINTSRWYMSHLQGISQEEELLSTSSSFALDPRLITGLLILPAFLLQESLIGVIIIAVIALTLARLHGRRIRLVPNVLIFISVVTANLLQKNGLVITEFFGFEVTSGALELGIKKAVTLIGLIYISQFMVSKRPALPGRFGSLVSLQLYYFEQVLERWKETNEDSLFSRIDSLMILLEETTLVDSRIPDREESKDLLPLYVIIISVCWTLLFIL